MFDGFGLPRKHTGHVSIYTQSSGTNGAGYQVWTKPRGASIVTMLCMSGGGGGGGGYTRTAGNPGGGGGGGACSGLVRFTCPAVFIPDTLYIQVGAGGQGGAASGNGVAGTHSYILFSKTAVLPNILLYSGINVPGGGFSGAAGAAGNAGSVPSVAQTQPANTWGQWFGIVGVVGKSGGVHTGAAGGDATATWAAIPTGPGAGGAGCTTTDYDGGSVSATAATDFGSEGYYNVAIAAAGTGVGAAIDGSAGRMSLAPFFNSGGAGGGSNNSGQAGNGGNGGYGCGGGGGGAGTTGGRGGNGGSGIVVICCI